MATPKRKFTVSTEVTRRDVVADYYTSNLEGNSLVEFWHEGPVAKGDDESNDYVVYAVSISKLISIEVEVLTGDSAVVLDGK